MKPIAESELVLNKDGSIYHLHLHPEQIAETILIVGDQGRVQEISKHFDRIEYRISNREFLTHTGYLGSHRISALSTGIGPDNIDIVLNELDALFNIDLKNRQVKKQKRKARIIRLGTSGALQKDIPIDSFIASEHAIGLDNLMYFYENKCLNIQLAESFKRQINWPQHLTQPYFCSGSQSLLRKFPEIKKGITATAPGFYGPQNRTLRLKKTTPNLDELLAAFEYENLKITNFEMETSALYGFGKLLDHECLTICAILANRATKRYSKNHKKTIASMITYVLEQLNND